MKKNVLTVLTFAAFALVIVSLATTAYGQGVTGQVSGTIVDPQGAVIGGASAVLTNTVSSQAREVQSDTSGNFVFPDVPAGTYDLSVTHPSFKTYQQTGIVVSVAERVALHEIKLEIGGVTQSVTVQADAARVQTDSSEHSGTITSTQIEDLSTKGRDYLGLISTLPGVVTTGARDINGAGAPAGLAINGRTTGLAIMLDGVINTNSGLQSATGDFSPNVEAVGEMHALLSNYQAEYGVRPNGQINVTTKSGTKAFHGSVYYFGRNEALNANSANTKFLDTISRGPDGVIGSDAVNGHATQTCTLAFRAGCRAQYRFNNFGFTLGGPIYVPHTSFNRNKDKLFFFFALDEWKRKTATPLVNSRFPTPAERTGDFSHTCNGACSATLVNGLPTNVIKIIDPTTGQQFAGNIVPANRQDPFGASMLNFWPQPTLCGGDKYCSANPLFNYTELPIPIDQPQHEYLTRIDWNPGPNTTIYGRYSRDFSTGRGAAQILNPGFPIWGGENLRRDAASYTVDWVQTIRPTLVNDFLVGLTHDHELRPPDPAGYKVWTRANPNFPGFATLGQLYPQINPWLLPPNIQNINVGAGNQIGGASSPQNITIDTFWPFYVYLKLFNFQEGLTWVRGNHNFKFGAYVEAAITNASKGAVVPGALDFGQNNNNPYDTGFAYSNVLLGSVNSYQESSNSLRQHGRYKNIDWYVQDSWKANSHLTLDYGVRFQFQTPTSSKGDIMTNFIPGNYDPAKAARVVQWFSSCASRPAGSADPQGICTKNPNQAIGYDPVSNIVVGAGLATNVILNDPGRTPWQGEVLNKDNALHNPPIGVGPRFGFAYDVAGNGKTAIRGGFGAFYDRPVGDTPQTQMLDNPSPVIFTTTLQFLTLDQLRSLTQSKNVQYGGNNAGGGPVQSTVVDYSLPVTYSYSLGVQRALPFGMVADISYVGNVGHNQRVVRNINNIAAPYGAFGTVPVGAPGDLFRPYQDFTQIQYQSFDGSINYNSVQVSANRRFGKSWTVGGNWVYSKSLAYNAFPAEIGLNNPVLPRKVFYGPTPQDHRHTVNLNWTYNTPDINRLGQSFFTNNKVTKTLLNGWTWAGNAAFVSGAPQAVGFGLVGAPGTLDITGCGPGCADLPTRVSVSGNPVRSKGSCLSDGVSCRYQGHLNPAAIVAPLYGPASKGLTATPGFGNGGPAQFYGPGVNNVDMFLYKNIRLGKETRALQFRAEAYNVFNHMQFTGVNTTAQFINANCQITACPNVNNLLGSYYAGAYNQATGKATPTGLQPTQPARVMVLALKFTF